MNPVAMVLPASTTPKLETSVRKAHQLTDRNSELTPFAKLLQNNELAKQVEQPTNSKEMTQQITEEELTDKLKELGIKELENLLRKLPVKEDSDEDVLLFKELAEELKETQQSGDEKSQAVSDLAVIIEKIVQFTSAAQLSSLLTSIHQSEPQQIINAFPKPGVFFNSKAPVNQESKQLLYQVESLLNKLDSGEKVSKISPKITELLQQWQKNVETAGLNPEKTATLTAENKQLSSLLKQIMEVYQSRTETGARQQPVERAVSEEDVARWLSKTMDGSVQSEKVVQPLPVMTTTAPMSRVEQFVIHVNQSHQAQPVDKQLVEQFQRIMDTNKISHLQNNRGQLAITLKPHNLGEMLVRFTQVNGEMMVKILVTSDSAKRMLEGNIQQLRSMFSPHQVVIDKQETVLAENQESEKQHSREEQQDTREGKHSNEKQQKQEADGFSTIFEELIVNEEV